MWLIVTLIATIISGLIYFFLKGQRKRYRLGLLMLMLLGTSLMVLVDHFIAFMEGGDFIETTTDGLITNSTLLGLVMVVAVLIVWAIMVLIKLSSDHKVASRS